MTPWTQSQAQRKSTTGQLQFVKCSKCNPSPEERKARQADQRAKQMRFKTELEHAGCEEDLDPIEDLLELDVLKKVYKDPFEDTENMHNGRYGLMPLLALHYVGNNLASSYCERSRANSCATMSCKLIMSHDRTLLDDEELEMVCFLRMNRAFLYYMKHPGVCKRSKRHCHMHERAAVETNFL